MFCKMSDDGKTIVVSATWLGKLLRAVTFGWVRPSVVLNRDFGIGCDDGKCLMVKSPCNVTLNGSLLGYPASIVVSIKDGSFSDPNVWKSSSLIGDKE